MKGDLTFSVGCLETIDCLARWAISFPLIQVLLQKSKLHYKQEDEMILSLLVCKKANLKVASECHTVKWPYSFFGCYTYMELELWFSSNKTRNILRFKKD